MARRPATAMELSQEDRALLAVWSRARAGKALRQDASDFNFERTISLVVIFGGLGFYRYVSQDVCTGTGCFTLLVQVLGAMALVLFGAWAGSLMMSAIGHEVRVRRFVRRRVAEYQAGDADAVSAVHEVGLEQLNKLVETHQASRTIGPDSEWSRARALLATALDEVEGTIAQWEERSADEPDSELPFRQLRTLRKLEAKLCAGLREVDDRADVLRQFYQRLEAKLVLMDRGNADLTRVRRLRELSGKAGPFTETQGTVEMLAQRFLAEAKDILHALGSVDRSQLGIRAGFASYDNVELLADKIHEASERDRSAVRQVEKTLEEQPT